MFSMIKLSKSSIAAAAFGVVSIFAHQGVNAQTATLNVSATVQNACAFGSLTTPASNYSMAFGTFTIGGTSSNASVAVDVECASATPFTIAADGLVTGREMSNTSNPAGTKLKYNLFKDVAGTVALGSTGGDLLSSSGPVGGGLTSNTIYGVIPQLGNALVPAGSYTDTVTLTLAF